MAISPNDPYQHDPYGGDRDTDMRSPTRLDADLQADPEMTEGPISAGRIAAFAVAIVVVFAAVFYGMNATSTNPNAPAVATDQTAPAPQTSADNGTPQAQRPNAGPGMTTGAAPANAPTGTEIERSNTTTK